MVVTVKEHSELGWAYIVIYKDLGNCGCGDDYGRLILLKEVLNALPLYENKNPPGYLDSPLGEWFLTILDKGGLIDHGSTIGGSWITDKGRKFLDVLNDEKIFKAFLEDDIGMCECEDCDKI